MNLERDSKYVVVKHMLQLPQELRTVFSGIIVVLKTHCNDYLYALHTSCVLRMSFHNLLSSCTYDNFSILGKV